MDNLSEICRQLNFTPKKCMEVGCAHIDTAQLREFVKNGTECILFECNPRLFHCLKFGFNNENGKNFADVWPSGVPLPPYDNPGWGNLPNVKLIHLAVADQKGTINMFEKNSSSFIAGVNSPAKVNDGYQENLADATLVPCDTIDKFDPGDIDLLACDCEGSEFFALKHLISRPKVIVLEMMGQKYTNPYFKEITQWMQDNNYSVAGQDATDVCFVKNG